MTGIAIEKTKTLGERLRDTRTRQGLSGEALGKLTGIAQSNISKYEVGRVTNPSAEHLFTLADALKVSARWLITGHKAKDPRDALFGLPLTDNMQRLVNHLQTLDDSRLTGLFALLGVKHE